MLCFAAGYSGSGDDRTCTGLVDNVTARYTAPYTGTVTIDVSKLVFANTWSALFCILVNGEPVGQFDTEGFNYANGAGWLDPTATDSTDLVEDITVTVNKGDVIDFVVRGTGADINNITTVQPGETFKYAGAKYGLKDWGFGVTYDAYKTSVGSTFNVTENFILDGYETWQTTAPTTFTNSGAWQAGILNVTLAEDAIAANTALNQYLSVGSSFLAFNTIRGWNANEFFVERTDYSGSGLGSRAFYIVPNSSRIGGSAVYLTTGLNYNWTSSGSNMVDYAYAPTLRYIAQFGGELTVDLDGGWYSSFAKGFQHLWVRHNDTVYDILNEGTDVSKTYTFNVKKGDVIEFISLIDPILSLEYNSLDPNAAAIWNPSSTNSMRRGFRIDNIDVTYTSVANESKWAASSAISSNALSTSSSMVRFFQWFKDGSTTPLAIGTALDSTCVAKINPDLITAGVFSADDTLAVAYEKFCDYLKKNAEITSNNKDWAFGNVKSDGTFSEFKYFAFYHSRSLLLAQTSVQYANADGNGYHAPLAGWNQMMTYIMSDLKTKAGLNDTDVVSNIAIPSSVAAGLTQYVDLTQGTTALGFTSGAAFDGYNSDDQAGFRYTAPLDGKLTMAIDSLSCNKTGTYKFKIFVNGVAQQSDWVAGAANSAAEIASALSTLGTIDVQAGDTVLIAFARNDANTFTPNFTATLVGAPAFNTTAALTIDDAYGVKMTATPLIAGGKISAYIDGAWVEGTLTNGAYTFTLKDGINVSDLTATKNASEAERDGVTVSYQLKEVVNGHTVISALYSTTTDKMLSYYEASANAKLAALAKDIRHLAVAAKAAIAAPNGSSLEQSEKNYIIKANTPLTALKEAGANVVYTGDKGDFQIVGANVNMDNRLSMVILMSAIGDKTLDDLRNGGYYVEAVCGDEVVKAETIRGITQGNTEYMGAYLSVPISMYNQQFEYTIKDADDNAVSDTLLYSVQDWCIRNYKNSWENKYYVVRAMYNLGESAVAYRAWASL